MAVSLADVDKGDVEEVSWAVIEAISELNDNVAALVQITKWMREVYKLDEDDADLISNPAFGANGHDGRSPTTRDYLRSRGFKNFGGAVVGLAGSLGSAVTFVDVGGILKEGNATGSTLAHIINVRAAGARFKRSETVTRWVDAVIKAKTAKAALRGAGLAASAIPIPAVGLAASIALPVAKLAIRVNLAKLMARTAMELHWRAYQETAISRQAAPVGPASGIFYEIFTRRGFTRVFGAYDTQMLIKEPAGWMALNDKLMLM